MEEDSEQYELNLICSAEIINGQLVKTIFNFISSFNSITNIGFNRKGIYSYGSYSNDKEKKKGLNFLCRIFHDEIIYNWTP